MKYFLLENKMTPDPDDCVAKITQQETVSYDELIKRATRRGITITDTELKGAISELLYTIVEELNKGRAVDTPFVRYRPSIGGVFKNKDDVFDPNRHIIKINCTIGKDINVDILNIPLEKVKYIASGPYIERIFDYASQEENTFITPGGSAEISGELLKIDMDDAEQGLFFINNASSTKVEFIMRNLPSDLIFNIPAGLAPGDYQLEIRNKTYKADKAVKNYLFPSLLTVR